MALLHLLHHNDQIEVKDDFFSHGITSLQALLLCYCILVAPFCLIGQNILKQDMT